MRRKAARILVDSEFKRFLKVKSAEEDLTLLEYTSRMMDRQKYPEFFPFKDNDNKKRSKKGGFDFGL